MGEIRENEGGMGTGTGKCPSLKFERKGRVKIVKRGRNLGKRGGGAGEIGNLISQF